MIMRACPGAQNIRGTPTLTEKACPVCGEIIEIFSIDVSVQCKCGFVAYNDVQSCIKWCARARECVGEEVYERLINHMLTKTG